jgi:hypothetical protein
MSMVSISGTDLKHAGWNLVAFGAVGVSSGLLAWGVYKLAFRIYSHYKPSPSFSERDDIDKNFRWLGLGISVGAVFGLHATLSASRFAPINNPSLGKMFTLGAGQAAAGAIVDLTQDSFPLFTAVGVSTAIAGHWSRYALVVFGITGAAIGAIHAQ